MSRKPKVAIIDDSELVLAVTRQILVDNGFEVLTIDSPIGATIVIGKQQPDLVLVDLKMASLTGDRVVSVLKRGIRTQHLRVVLYSGQQGDGLAQVAHECGADGFIVKTDDEQAFLAHVRSFLEA